MHKTLSDAELLRYSRHILLADIDVLGQYRLRDSRIAIVGLGGLGSPVALYLAAAGIGQLILMDADGVDLSNLQRQIIHCSASIGQSKVQSAGAAIQSLNPHVQVSCIGVDFTAQIDHAQLASCDVILDCTDRLSSRLAINEYAVTQRIPLVSASALGWAGHIHTYDPNDALSACMRCLYRSDEERQARCETEGVVGPLLGILGSMQALEVLKLLLKQPTLARHLLHVDARQHDYHKIILPKQEQCPVCGVTCTTSHDSKR